VRMAITVREARVQAAARVITAHRVRYRETGEGRAPVSVCYCGQEWHPLHVAIMLDEAAALGPYFTRDGMVGGPADEH
jgi:hypothetical protein